MAVSLSHLLTAMNRNLPVLPNHFRAPLFQLCGAQSLFSNFYNNVGKIWPPTRSLAPLPRPSTQVLLISGNGIARQMIPTCTSSASVSPPAYLTPILSASRCVALDPNYKLEYVKSQWDPEYYNVGLSRLEAVVRSPIFVALPFLSGAVVV
jgi:hypothetical protein